MIEAVDGSGQFRRFGVAGPLYEVLRTPGTASAEKLARIRLVESGEEADYPLAQLIADPVVA